MTYSLELSYKTKGQNINSIKNYGLYKKNLSDTKQAVKAGAKLILDPDKASGQYFPKLLPRTLPNGVKNADYVQNVSDDYIIKASDIITLDTAVPEFIRAVIPQSTFVGINAVTDTAMLTMAMSGKFVPKNNLPNRNYSYYAPNISNIVVFFPLGTTLEQAHAELAGIVVRYQLATPISTVNVPFVNPMIDLANRVGKNLFDIVAALLAVNNSSKAKISTVDGRQVLELNQPNVGFYTGKPGVRYTLQYEGRSAIVGSVSGMFCFKYTDGSISYLSPTSITWTKQTFISSATKDVLYIGFIWATGGNICYFDLDTIQIEEGIVATEVEPFKQNNAMLVNSAQTTADGYVPVLLPNGNTKVMFKPDGIDTCGKIVDNGSVDIIGTNDFAIGDVGIFVAQDGFVICKNLDSEATTQYALKILADGSVNLLLNATSIVMAPVSTLTVGNAYKIFVYRVSGVLKCLVNGIETYNSANTTSIVTQPNFGLFSRSNSVDGLTRATYLKNNQAPLHIYYNGATGLVEANVIKAFDRYVRGYF